MKTRAFLLSLVLIFALPALSDAQVGNVLKNKVGRAINAGAKVLNKEADKKIDSAATREAQEAYDKAERERAAEAAAREEAAEPAKAAEAGEETEQRADDRPAGGFNLGGLMGSGKVTSKYNESYSFNNRIYTEIEMYDGKDVAKMNYFIYFNNNNVNAGFESKLVGNSDESGQVEINTSFIVDGDNKSFIMMTDMGGMRVGVISEMPDENTAEGQDASEDLDATFTKTGNTKMIAGYKCDEYKYVDNDTKEYGFIWATKDLKLQADKRTFSKAGMSPYYGSKDLDNSVVLGMEGYNKKGELEMKSETKEVNLGYNHGISTTGYSFRQVNFSQAGQKKKK
jgi:hypothetical protein